MSRFLLCWHRDGDPLHESLRRKVEAIVRPPGTAAARRLDRSDVVAWHWQSAWAPGSEESLPLECEGWTGSGVLRLDDRAALVAKLRDAGSRGPEDDATLAWRSLRVWGAHAARHWLGDYAVAAVTANRERMVVARGVTGVRSCFHTTVRGVECVSDDLALLAALGRSDRRPVERAVAEFLRLGYLATPTLTFHEGVTRIPAAHTLVVERDGRRRLERHWALPAPETRHGLGESAVIEEFHDVVGTAISDRLRAPAATLLLSGGLDSPALAVEAHRACPHVALRGVTASWARLLGDDEARFARMAAAAAGIEHEVWEHAPDDGLAADAAFTSPEPLPDSEPRLWRAQAARLAALAPVSLLGEDVDALLAPLPLLAQLRHDGVARTVSAWREHRARTGERPWIGARRSLAAIERWRDRRATRAPRWLRGEVTASNRLPHFGSDVEHPTRMLAARALTHPIWDATCWLEDPRMSGAEVAVLLPFMDPRVIRFCFSLPSVPWLQRKHLIRRAMRGFLPTELLERPKSPLVGYATARVRVWRELGAAVPLPAAVDSWVDLESWRAALASSDADETVAAWRVLELSRWLAQPAVRVP